MDASGAPQVICERVVHEVQLLRVGELAVRRKKLPIGAASYSSNAELGAATLACCPPAMRLASAAVATEAQPGGGVELVHVFAHEVGAVRQMVLALVFATRGRQARKPPADRGRPKRRHELVAAQARLAISPSACRMPTSI